MGALPSAGHELLMLRADALSARFNEICLSCTADVCTLAYHNVLTFNQTVQNFNLLVIISLFIRKKISRSNKEGIKKTQQTLVSP